ncbi:hypothetical protein P154DRAFT_471134, partial [Amniculicola lignicola CBS 123094]
MGYAPLNVGVRNADGFELQNTQYSHDYQQHNYAPPVGSPPPSDFKAGGPRALSAEHQSLIKNWPTHAEPVARLTPWRMMIMFFDAIFASLPVMFIALALIAARLDGKKISAYGLHLHQTLLLSPTIFPVVFAALMGRCFKHVGLYRAERGISLGRLEQLVGCTSLFSALERQLLLRSWSILGFLMTLIWLLSPLGGQSALRLLGEERAFSYGNDTFQYLDPASLEGTFLSGSSSANSGRSTFTSLFLAALLSSGKYQATPMDLWGNVKIPTYRSVANSTSDPWKTVDHTKNVTYASLIGIPVAGIHPQSGESNFTIKARQWDITCDSNREMSKNESKYGNATATWKLNYTDSGCTTYPCAITLKSIDSTLNISMATCNLSFEYIEAAIGCDNTTCQANAIRKLDLLDDTYTNGTNSIVKGVITFNLMIFFPSVDNFGVSDAGGRGSSNMERWLLNPWNFIGVNYENIDLYTVPASVLGERLTMLWNSFFQATYGTAALGGNLPANLTSLKDQDMYMGFNGTSATTRTPMDPIYKANWPWFVALLVSSIVLQIAAYTGLVLKYITLAPDIIGFASSMTLLNPYLPTPAGGTTLHGLERAALLKDVQVRIGDVCPGEPVGAVSVGLSDRVGGRVARLRRGRWYI